MVAKMSERMGGDRAFLFGRRTYEDLLAYWNTQGGSFKDALNSSLKYIASSNPAAKARLAELNSASRRPCCRSGGPQGELGHEPRDHGERRADHSLMAPI
jgi:hypothetical protein